MLQVIITKELDTDDLYPVTDELKLDVKNFIERLKSSFMIELNDAYDPCVVSAIKIYLSHMNSIIGELPWSTDILINSDFEDMKQETKDMILGKIFTQ